MKIYIMKIYDFDKSKLNFLISPKRAKRRWSYKNIYIFFIFDLEMDYNWWRYIEQNKVKSKLMNPGGHFIQQWILKNEN